MRACSWNEQLPTSDAWPFTVIAETPATFATSDTWFRLLGSSIERSSLKHNKVAGITPDREKLHEAPPIFDFDS